MTIAQAFRLTWRVLILFLVTTILTVIGTVHSWLIPKSKHHIYTPFYFRAWSKTLLTVFSVKLDLAFENSNKPASGQLVISNHSSPLDIVILAFVFQGRFLSQIEIKHWPLIGYAARKLGTIFVNRGNAQSGMQAMNEIRDQLKKPGRPVVLFPESVASTGDKINRFRRGAFSAAKNTGIQIIPVGMAYPPGTEWIDETFVQHLRRVAVQPGGTIAVRVGRAYQLTDTPEKDAEIAREKIQVLVHTARKALNERLS